MDIFRRPFMYIQYVCMYMYMYMCMHACIYLCSILVVGGYHQYTKTTTGSFTFT